MDRFKSKETVTDAIQCYGDTLMKICLALLGNRYDAEDVIQETFIAYMVQERKFSNRDHEKAWLIRVAVNKAKNVLRYHRAHEHINLEDIKEFVPAEEKQEQMAEVMQLPFKIKTAVHLHYYEGYTCKEIAAIVGASEAAVKKRLQKGRQLLREILGGMQYE